MWDSFFYRNLRETCLQSDFLCGLKLCTNLKKFSLNSVRISYEEGEIDDDSFLEEVTSSLLKFVFDFITLTYSNVSDRNKMPQSGIVEDTRLEHWLDKL